jgi:hypothetical protein
MALDTNGRGLIGWRCRLQAALNPTIVARVRWIQ